MRTRSNAGLVVNYYAKLIDSPSCHNTGPENSPQRFHTIPPKMGGCFSVVDEDDVDSQQASEPKRLRCEHKLLLLGSSDSGKSTIFKQMKIIYQKGFTEQERLEYRPVVYKNLTESAQDIVLAMHKLGMSPEDPLNHDNAYKIMGYNIELISSAPTFRYPEDLAISIRQLSKDKIIIKLMDDHSSDFYLMDSASYFFEEAKRIGKLGYVPTETDVLRSRQKSTAIVETRFSVGPLQIHMFDVGGRRSERKKWIHCFESVTSIIFCVALSEYDQVLLEEKSQNRMTESLVLFDSIVNSRWFLRTSIVLFMNKINVFRLKISKTPLKKCFSEYTGSTDESEAVSYILRRFMETNLAKLSVYPHLTQATNTTNMRLVFDGVAQTITQGSLQGSGLL